MTKKPKVLGSQVVASSRLFSVEAVDLEFSNGQQVSFERIMGGKDGIVMVMAINTRQELILIKEYATGVDRYELGFVKGKVDPGEAPEVSAQRELKEEIGFGAERITFLREIRINPGYSNFRTFIYLAEGLFEETLQGDEIEPLEQVTWPLAEIDKLHQHEELTDVRTLYGLYLLKEHLSNRDV